MSSGVAIDQTLDKNSSDASEQIIDTFRVRTKTFEIHEHSGEVIEVRNDGDGAQHIFVKYENGIEEDYRLSDVVGVRQGHKVTVFFFQRQGDELGHVAGLKNHNTGKSCYRDAIGEHYFPSHWGEAFLAGAVGSLDNTNDMMASRSALMGLLMLPIFIIMAGIALAVFLVGLLFCGNTASARKQLKEPMQEYMAKKHNVEWPKKKKGFWGYTWRIALGFFVVMVVLDILGGIYNAASISNKSSTPVQFERVTF